MILRTSLLILPIFAFAQESVPPEVDQELRARVTAFYQNFLVESYAPRKAEPFVAEDTKDSYYEAGKAKYISFQVGKITYSDHFTKAVVVVVGKMEKRIAAQSVVMDVPNDTHWKIENGKWCFTYNPSDYPVTPMSVKNPPPAGADTRGPVIPKNNSPEAMQAAGIAVLKEQTMGVDKSTVTFAADQASSTEVVFSNGADGEVQIALDGPVVRGLTAKLDKRTVPGHGTAVLSLRYDPSVKNAAKDVWEPKGSILFRIVAAPFDRPFPVHVQFAEPK
ncbi:MAG TPA: hypothetical protein VK752_11240 [Bryobacteraceae bacterium]|jgi:hypothetical protein|nr:hypothetical protein [Bryobacteraceae bacterium]